MCNALYTYYSYRVEQWQHQQQQASERLVHAVIQDYTHVRRAMQQQPFTLASRIWIYAAE